MTKLAAGDICFNELATVDVNKAKDFYSSVFGWQFSDHKVGDMMYTMIKSNDKEFGGLWRIPEEQHTQIPPHWMAYILVDDIKNALEKAKQQGAKVMKEKTQVGEIGFLAVIIDPTGAHIAMWEGCEKDKS